MKDSQTRRFVVLTLQVLRRVNDDDLKRRSDKSFDEVPAVSGTVAFSNNDMGMHCRAIFARADVA